MAACPGACFRERRCVEGTLLLIWGVLLICVALICAPKLCSAHLHLWQLVCAFAFALWPCYKSSANPLYFRYNTPLVAVASRQWGSGALLVAEMQLTLYLVRPWGA